MEKSRTGLCICEIIDPFSEEYRELSAARADAHYKKLYEEIFERIPTRARAAIAKGYTEYINKCARPFLDLLNPVSWVNPAAVLRDAVEILENSLNLYVGSAKYLRDLMVSAKLIEDSDIRFKLGENIAATPCEIVHETDLLSLKRFIPSGETVYRTPVLMIYSLINGYYIMDLTRELSLIGFFVDKGYEVFVTDWKLITEKTRRSTMEDYVLAQK